MAGKTAAQEFSSAVFGRTHHLALVLYIAGLDERASFTQKQLERALGVSASSSIQRSVANLERAGFIRRLGARGGEQPYQRVPSTLWTELAPELAISVQKFIAARESGRGREREVSAAVQTSLFIP